MDQLVHQKKPHSNLVEIKSLQPFSLKISGIKYGYCHCGCGRKTNIAMKTITKKRIIKGCPRKFIHGHHMGRGPLSFFWKGGKSVMNNGYIRIYKPSHPRAAKYGYVLEHILIAEKVLKKPLLKKHCVHHYSKKHENTKIVICENHAYHFLLHVRKRALLACGNPNFRKCCHCKKYDNIKNMRPTKQATSFFHQHCASLRQKERKNVKNRMDK